MAHRRLEHAHIARTPRRGRPVCWAAAGAFMLAGASVAQPFPPPPGHVIRTPRPQARAVPPDVQQPIWADLDLLVDPLQPGAHSSEAVPEYLLYQLVDQLTAKRYEEAEQTARALVDRVPERATAHYNLACVLALRGRTDAALGSLQRAVELGWRNRLHLRIDPDLASLRQHEGYHDLLKNLDEHLRNERGAAVPLRVDGFPKLREEIASILPDLLSSHHVPGISLAVIRNGETLWTMTSGVRDARQDAPLSEQDLFRSTTATTLLTALAALQLEAMDVWSLDDPIARWLPEFLPDHPDLRDRITIRQVLTHTAGLRSQLTRDMTDGTDDLIRRSVAFDPTRHGARYLYNRAASLLVGRAIERTMIDDDFDPATSEEYVYDFATRTRATILRPLQMLETYPRQLARLADRLVVGHTELGTPFRDPIEPARPGNPVYITIHDYARLLELLTSASAEASPVQLPADAWSQMLERPLEGATGFGLGVRLSRTDFGTYADLTDVHLGLGSLVRWYPTTRTAVVIMYNSETGHPLAERLAHMILGGEHVVGE